jgi:hypothetical protein
MLTAGIKGGDKWKAHLQKLTQKKLRMRVGIWDQSTTEEGATITEYATCNEYGTRRMPSRPFMRNTEDAESKKWLRIIRQRAKATPEDLEAAFELAGEVASKDIMATIEAGQFEPLAEATIERKRARGKMHPERPLIDTGAMQEAVSYEVLK